MLLPMALGVLLAPEIGQATCSREDIDHYLARGFTPEQITQLCGKGGPEEARLNIEILTPEPRGGFIALRLYEKSGDHRGALLYQARGTRNNPLRGPIRFPSKPLSPGTHAFILVYDFLGYPFANSRGERLNIPASGEKEIDLNVTVEPGETAEIVLVFDEGGSISTPK